jgi:hypothetical protein
VVSTAQVSSERQRAKLPVLVSLSLDLVLMSLLVANRVNLPQYTFLASVRSLDRKPASENRRRSHSERGSNERMERGSNERMSIHSGLRSKRWRLPHCEAAPWPKSFP